MLVSITLLGISIRVSEEVIIRIGIRSKAPAIGPKIYGTGINVSQRKSSFKLEII